MDETDSTAPEKTDRQPIFFIRGIVNDPVLTTFATAEPLIVPKKALLTTATFAWPASEIACQGVGEVDKKFSRP